MRVANLVINTADTLLNCCSHSPLPFLQFVPGCIFITSPKRSGFPWQDLIQWWEYVRHRFLVHFSYLRMILCQATGTWTLHFPNPHSLPQHVCHCCSVPKACLSQTFSLGEMFTIHVKGEKQQGHCLKSEAQSKGRAPLVVKLWSALEKSVCLLFQLMSHIRRSVLYGFCQVQHTATSFSVPAFLVPLKRWSPSATKHLNICSTLMEVVCWARTLSASSLWSFKGTRRDA